MALRDTWHGWRKQGRDAEKPWKLFRQAIRDVRGNWKRIGWLITIVGLPVAILSTYTSDPSGNSALSAYLAFAQIAMNTALTYFVVKAVNGKRVGVRESYYAGSAMLIRLMLVSLLLVLMLIPLLIGLLIFAIGVIAPNAPLSGGEQALLIVLAIIVSVPSVVMVVRGMWAAFIIFETDLGPLQAVSASRTLTKGRVVVTLGRLLALIPLLILILFVPIGILVVINGFIGGGIIKVLMQMVITLLVLPLGNFYLFRYYRSIAT